MLQGLSTKGFNGLANIGELMCYKCGGLKNYRSLYGIATDLIFKKNKAKLLNKS